MLALIQNQISALPNHRRKIRELLEDAKNLNLSIAYIRNTGVDIVADDIKAIIDRGGKIRIICTDAMGITQASALKRLLNIGATIKVCKLNIGTFHAKFWLLEKTDGWHFIVGSANLSKSAFEYNVEASLAVDQASNSSGSIEQALLFFEYLWNQSIKITPESLETWKEREDSQIEVKSKIDKTKEEPTDTKVFDVLWTYVKSWMDIAKFKKQKDNYTETLWRGWYIIPDQDLISDLTMLRLQKVLTTIRDNLENGVFDISPESPSLNDIFRITRTKFKRANIKMSLRDLFIRQEKNYLEKFGFIIHPIKANGKNDSNSIVLTSSGLEFANGSDIKELKRIYSDNMIHYSWGDSQIFYFACRLILELEYIDLTEFSLFAMHAYSDTELQNIVDLIKIYRTLNSVQQEAFFKKTKDYLEDVKGGTGQNVVGNYFKHCKYNMSAIGWIEGLIWIPESNNLQLQDATQIYDLLDRNDFPI